MDHDEAADLLRRRFGRAVAPRLTEQLLRRADGDPTLLAAVAGQVDPDGDGLHRVPLSWPAAELDGVRERLDALTPASAQALAAASVIGREFDVSILEALCPGLDVL